MKTIKIVIVILFCIFSIIEIYAALTNQSSLKFISTPTLMPLLAIYYVLSTRKLKWLVIAALVLSFIGDILNQWQSNDDIFIIETGAFLLALICYIIVLNQPISHWKKAPVWIHFLSILYIIYGIAVYLTLRPYLGEMELACIVYLLVVLMMGFSSLARVGQFTARSLWFPLIGSLFFIASDTVLAANAFKYGGQMRYGDFLATVSYIPAQVLITLGLLPADEKVF